MVPLLVTVFRPIRRILTTLYSMRGSVRKNHINREGILSSFLHRYHNLASQQSIASYSNYFVKSRKKYAAQKHPGMGGIIMPITFIHRFFFLRRMNLIRRGGRYLNWIHRGWKIRKGGCRASFWRTWRIDARM